MFLMSIHCDLQLNIHFPHWLHPEALNRILYSDFFDTRPSNVPTGQTVLQYKRPFHTESQTTSANMTTGTINEYGFVLTTVTGYNAYDPKDVNIFTNKLLHPIYSGRNKSEKKRPKLLKGSKMLNSNILPVNNDKKKMTSMEYRNHVLGGAKRKRYFFFPMLRTFFENHPVTS